MKRYSKRRFDVWKFGTYWVVQVASPESDNPHPRHTEFIFDFEQLPGRASWGI